MKKMHPRLERERQTIERMIDLYCHEVHSSMDGDLCPDCTYLKQYALERLRCCPFQERKSTCAKCTVHCYKPAMREQVRMVMRYAGPRMLTKHPLLAISHLFDGLRKPPVLERKYTHKKRNPN